MSILFEAVEPIAGVVHHFNRYDEDAVDRLNHKYSTFVFVILAIVVTTNQYVGEIIKCWAPAEFPESWVDYTNSICWISNTYYIPMSEYDILNTPKQEIVYYQWVPLVLFLQAFMFYLPSVFWSVLNRTTGLDIKKIVQSLRQTDHINPDSRDKCTRHLVKHIDRYLTATQQFRTGDCTAFKHKLADIGCLCGKRYGNFLIAIYLLTKLVYIADSILQLYMMNLFLGTDYIFYGLDVLNDLTTSGAYKESRRFPRVTLCDFEIRSLGKNIPHTVQCTLPVNLFNEKIFIFVWFWLVFLSLINILSMVYWLWIAFTTNRRRFVKTYLKVAGRYDRESDIHKLNGFCEKYLRHDGHFLLRMVGKNTNEVMVGEMVVSLWEHFCRNYNIRTRKQEV